MPFAQTDILPLLETAGIKVAEAARMFRVSRGTVYNWSTGIHPKNPFLLRRATDICVTIQKAVTEGKLPPPSELKADERFRFIERTLCVVKRAQLTAAN